MQNWRIGCHGKKTKNGIFSIKSLYSAVEPGNAVRFPKNIIWSPYVPPKVGFFAWEASWGKVLTLDQLKKRGWTLANRCFFCLTKKESTNHILIHCTKTRVLWELLFALFGLLGWYGSFVGEKRKKAWKLALLCLFWTVWKEKNRIAFDNEEFSVHRLKNSFVCSFWSWTKLYIDVGPLPLINFFYWLSSR